MILNVEATTCDGSPATRFVTRRDRLEPDGLGELLAHLMRCEACEAAVPGVAEEVRFDVEMAHRAARIERTTRVTEDDVAVLASLLDTLGESELRGLGRPFAVFQRVLGDALAYRAKVARHGGAAVLSAKLASVAAGNAGRGLAADIRAPALKVIVSPDARFVVELAPVLDRTGDSRSVALSVRYRAPAGGAPVLACAVSEGGDDHEAVECVPVVLRRRDGAWSAAVRLTFPSSWRSPQLAIYRMDL